MEIGGAEKSLINLLNNLDSSLYKITLVTFKPNGALREYVPHYVQNIQLDYPRLSFFDRLIFFIKRKTRRGRHHAQIYWSIAKNKFDKLDMKFDIAIAYNQGFATYFTSNYIEAANKFAWLNTDYTKAGYNITFDYLIYKNYESVVAVSPEAKISLENQLQRIAKMLPIAVIKDITDHKLMKEQAKELIPKPFDKNRINLVSVGRLASSKGFDIAVRACKILKDKGHLFNWYLIGEGSERKKLENLINSLGLKNIFILIGADPNPYRYIARADIYVQTSLFEGLGLTVIEAASLGKPIVSTDFPSVRGILEHEKTGLIVSMNPESIATSIERLMNDNKLREKFTKNRFSEENKTKDRTISQVIELMNV